MSTEYWGNTLKIGEFQGGTKEWAHLSAYFCVLCPAGCWPHHSKNNIALQGEALIKFFFLLVAWNGCINAVFGFSEKPWEAWWSCCFWALRSAMVDQVDWKMLCGQDITTPHATSWCNFKAKIWEDKPWFPVKHNCRGEGTTVMEWAQEKAPFCELLVPPQMVWRNSRLFLKGWDLGKATFPFVSPWYCPTNGLQHNSLSTQMLVGQSYFTKLWGSNEASNLEICKVFGQPDLVSHVIRLLPHIFVPSVYYLPNWSLHLGPWRHFGISC